MPRRSARRRASPMLDFRYWILDCLRGRTLDRRVTLTLSAQSKIQNPNAQRAPEIRGRPRLSRLRLMEKRAEAHHADYRMITPTSSPTLPLTRTFGNRLATLT